MDIQDFNEAELFLLETMKSAPFTESKKLIDIDRVSQIKKLYDELKLVMPTKARISLHLNEPFNDMSYISIVSSKIKMPYGEYMNYLFSIADNMEIYPQTDGMVRINIGFYNTTKEIV